MSDYWGRMFLRDRAFDLEVDETGVHIRIFDDGDPNAWLTISPWLLKRLNEEVNA